MTGCNSCKGNIKASKAVKIVDTTITRIGEIIKEHPNEKLESLAHLINVKTLEESHKRAQRNKATGVDGVTKEEYQENLEKNLEDLVARMKRQAYKPQPVRRVMIPKAGSNKMRPLGIPAYEDKLVQDVLSQILTQIFEPIFLDCSYGFRPNRNCHMALAKLERILNKKKINYIVDADIKGFFDNVNHDKVIEMLETRIKDPNILRLIKRFLIAGVMDKGIVEETEKGTPQGGLISPILANLYLHYTIDLWFDKKVKGQFKGEVDMVRYADDFVCCFQYKEEAEKFYEMLKERLTKMGLEVAEDKTKIIEFGRFAEKNIKERTNGKEKPKTFDFLGFTHYCSKGKMGKFRTKRKTSKKKFDAKVKAMRKWVKENMHKPVKNIIKMLNSKLTGHYNYYGITDNYETIRAFYRLARRILKTTLSRRSQKGVISWERFNKIIKRYPIVEPRIKVDIVRMAMNMT